MPTKKPQINAVFEPEDMSWLDAEAQRLRTSRSELVRRAVTHYRQTVELPATPPAPEPVPVSGPAPADTHTETEETPMPRPQKTSWNTMAAASKKGKWTADRPMPPELKVRPAQALCPSCQTTQWADADGLPRPHLRPSRPGDPDWSDLVPTMSPCPGPEGLPG